MTLRTSSPHGVLLALALLAASAHADSDSRVPLLPAYVQECGSCHVAFAPGLLPAASWQRLMADLGRHFGSDASLDAAMTRTLSGWLATHAGSGKRAASVPRDDRITQGSWFVNEHRDVRHVIGSAQVKSASDCAACHTRAADGSYREREIRIPK
jgi:cytochrome c553